MKSTWRQRRRAARAQAAGEASAQAAFRAAHPDNGSEAATEQRVTDEAGAETCSETGGETGGEVAGHRTDTVGQPADLTAAAFFDVDNTMMQGASLFHFARGLATRKFFTSRDVMRFAWRQVKFRVIGSENAVDAAGARAEALAFVAGREVDQVVKLGEEIYDELMAHKIYPGTRRLADKHIAAGQRVYLVTATPIDLAQIIARRLGLTGALGTVAETHGGRYTGRLVGDLLHGPAKAAAVRGLAAREGLNLARCTAYSDSINDAPMLQAVGTAVAINPDAALRRLARGRGWTVRDFRTGRKAVKIGVPSLLGAGAIAGGLATWSTLRRRWR